MLRNLIICRHGCYSGGGGPNCRLNETGIYEIQQLRANIAGILEAPMLVLSSTFARNLESAQILVEKLEPEVQIVKSDLLISGGSVDHNVDEALALVESHAPNYATIIVMTHLELTEEMPYYYGKKIGAKFPNRRLDYGRAYHIRVPEKTIAPV